MRSLITVAFFWLSFQCFCQPDNQEIVTNETIIQLYKAGISKNIIIGKINSSKCNFDLQTEKLIGLKKIGISDEVVEAMLAKSSANSDNNPNQKLNSTDSAKVLPSGIYYCKGTPCEMMELEPSVYSQSKIESGILSAFTYGIAKIRQRATLSGVKANLQIEDTIPAFYFYFDRSQTGNLSDNHQTWWFNAATSPNEFLLIKFTVPKGKNIREVITGSWNTWEGMTSGIDDTQKIPFKYEKTSQGVYRVYTVKALAKGEYSFMYAGGTSGYGSAPSQKVFDFGIK